MEGTHKNVESGGGLHSSRVEIPREWVDAIEKVPDKQLRKPWSPEEDAFILEYEGRKSQRALAKILGRSPSQISTRLSHLREGDLTRE